MSAGEIGWRVRSSLRDRADRLLVGRRQRARRPSIFLNGHGRSDGPRFRVSRFAVGESSAFKYGDGRERQPCESLLNRAQRIMAHRLDFFDLKDVHLGDPILWNRDHKRGQDTPMIFSPALDYRDVREAGDCKFVWEPNRHHQLVVLGRAYRLSGDARFAQAVAEQLDSWLEQNPFGVGMNWRSGLELGIRLINWVWALDLIEESDAIDASLRRRILDCVSRHIWEIDRKYSRGSSVNNHLIGEAAGVFVATSYFRNLRHASVWQERSREILNREIIHQTYADGGTAEQAIGYLFFVLQFFVAAGLTARATGRDMPEAYWSRLEKMFEFLGAISEGGDALPMFGDCDDGYVLDLGDDPHDVRQWLAVGAALYRRTNFKAWAREYAEPVEWLLGEAGRQRFAAIPKRQDNKIVSAALKDSSYYLLQYGESDSPDRISVVFDCGPLGMGPLGAHGHADALSFTLCAFGRDVLVDPGTYDYFSYPKWRRYFRSTAAHNTIVIDGQDQSEMLGLFLWGRRANARCLNWEPTQAGGKVTGDHDGYTHLAAPVIHRRTLELDGPNRTLIVRDSIAGRGAHKIDVHFHFAEHCAVSPAGANRYLVDVGPGKVAIELDRRLKVEQFKGSEDPICGWVSRGYHQKQAATTLVGRCLGEGPASLLCWIDIGNPGGALT
jgi:Heparinase II/III-like protein/Heparinase II/III N-terminus